LDICVAGHTVALNASTGAKVWDTQTAPVGFTGAGVWTSPAIDTANGVLYVGTGNAGSPCSAPSSVPLADSIVAVRLSTGAILDSYQAIPNDNGDLDFGSSPVLTSTEAINQCQHTYSFGNWVLEASKNGTLYSVQRGSVA